MSLKTCIIFLTIFTTSIIAHRRKLSTAINPGCHDPACEWKKEDSALLVHVRADGDNDTLHHIWDFTSTPSLLLVRTDHECVLNVSWDKYLTNNGTSVKFTTEPAYVFGVTLDKVFEFYDEHDVGTFDVNNRNESYVHIMNTRDFRWRLENINGTIVNDTETALLSVVGKRHDHKTNRTGIIRVSMGAYGGVEHGLISPHLLHSSNSSQMDLTLENMPTLFEKSRFGINLVMISSDHPNSSLTLNIKKTLDDEHDPGVFSIVEVTSPEDTESAGQNSDVIKGGYVQWRPVVYTSEARDTSNSLDTIQYSVIPVTDSSRLNKTLFHKLFGDQLNNYLISTTNVTFGAAGDKFYEKTHFASWTFVAGIGRPMEEKFSSLVLMILAIGLGLPIVLLVFGVLCVVVRRILKNKDDLFLSQ